MSVRLLSVLALLASVVAGAALPYEVLGSVDVGTGESSIFLFRGRHFLLDNIFCGYIDHFGQWDPRFTGHSYARIRDLQTGAVISNITASINTSFVSAFVDDSTGIVWLSALAEDRCEKQCGTGVLAIQSTDLVSWRASSAIPDVHTCNTEVARVDVVPPGMPAHKYVMILEPFSFMLNNNADGDLTHGWFAAPNATAPRAPSGGPSIRFEGGYYYVITGGHVVYLVRSRDLHTWSAPAVMIQPSAGDAKIAPLLGFAADEHRKGFDSMHNASDWDWNSNDADVCCSGGIQGAWLVWGASTQGAKPKPPATQSCTNAVGFANVTLGELLESFF